MTAVIVAGFTQALLAPFEAGITVDEPVHVDRAVNWVDDGWYVPTLTMQNGAPPETGPGNPNLYGPAFAALVQGVTFALGLGALDEVVTTAKAWEARHLLTALLGLSTALAAGLGVFLITRSRMFLLWTVAALLATPIWLGMSFFNPKDIPVAAGYTLVTVGLILALVAGRAMSPVRFSAGLSISALVGIGAFLAVGTRPALWAPLAVALLAYLTLALAGRPRSRRIREIGLGYVAAGFATAAVILLALYPAVFSEPLTLLVDSVSGSSSFDWDGFTLTAGRLLDETPPPWYLPIWTLASIPLGILLLAAGVVLATGARMFVRARAGGRGQLAHDLAAARSAPILLVTLQAVLLPLGSIAVGATMYTGIRQFLFVVPALAMLAGVGAAWLWRAAAHRRAGRWRPLVATGLCLALVVPMVEQSILFPYNYSYITPVAGIGGVNDRWETDYWWASSRDALARVPADQRPGCFVRPPAGPSAWADAPDCLSSYSSYFGPFAGERGTPGSGLEPAQWVLSRRRAGSGPLPGCDPAPSVTRWLRGEQVVMSYVMRCPAAGPEPNESSGPAVARTAQR